MPTADDAMIEAAARRAVRRAWRLRYVAGYDRDDALQDGRIGAWQALRACEVQDAEHRLNIAALAGYRQIVDGRRHRWAATAGGTRDADYPAMREQHEPSQPAAAPQLLAVADTLAAIARLREPLPRVAAMLIEGDDPGEIAGAFGVSPSRVSQWRGELRALVARVLCLAPAQTDRLQETAP